MQVVWVLFAHLHLPVDGITFVGLRALKNNSWDIRDYFFGSKYLDWKLLIAKSVDPKSPGYCVFKKWAAIFEM